MENGSIQALLIDRIKQRLLRMGLTEHEATHDLDLLRSGVLDSLSFVDLIADLSAASGIEVDLEAALDRKNATTIGGVVDLFNK